MIMYNLKKLEGRQELIKRCNSDEIKAIKNESIEEFNVYKNKLSKSVDTLLRSKRSGKSVDKMLLIDDIGACKRTINQKASVYKKAPSRSFQGVNDDQKEKLSLVYDDLKMNTEGKYANRYFKLQAQTLTQILPKKQKLTKRVLKRHDYTLIASEDDPEEIAIVVIHAFNQPSEKSDQRYVVWSSEYNFTMDGNGEIKTEEADRGNPIAPLLPFTEYAVKKDGDVYVDERETSVGFTVKLNAMMTEIFHIMRMQGFGQPVLKTSSEKAPKAEEVECGVDNILVLLMGDDGENAQFEFVTASPDLQGNINTLSVILSAWLSAEGLDMDSVKFSTDGGKSFSSGFERLLALIEKFEATQDDMEIFKEGEQNEFKIIAKYLNVLSNDKSQLDSKYSMSTIPEDASLSIEFAKPEEIQTKPEKISMLADLKDKGFGSLITGIMELKGYKSEEDAIEFLKTLAEHRKKEAEILGEPVPSADNPEEDEEE